MHCSHVAADRNVEPVVAGSRDVVLQTAGPELLISGVDRHRRRSVGMVVRQNHHLVLSLDRTIVAVESTQLITTIFERSPTGTLIVLDRVENDGQIGQRRAIGICDPASDRITG